MALIVPSFSQEAVAAWPVLRHHYSCTPPCVSSLVSYENMSDETSASSPLNIPEKTSKGKLLKELSEQSTESEGPVIIIHSLSSESETEYATETHLYETNQRPDFIALSAGDSAPSSSTDFTSEGGESEAEKRPLSPESVAALTVFLEEVLSNDGLSRDMFLLKHVRRHRHGFVSLKLLAGYKQAKKLNGDWKSLSVAARQSNCLEVDAEGRKVRRKKPLPDALLDVPQSRVIAAVDLTEDLMSMEILAATFGKYGAVASLHLLKQRRGGGIPEELQSLAARVPEVSHTTCAIIQYEDVWGVARALKEFSSPKTSLHIVRHRRRPSQTTPLPLMTKNNGTLTPTTGPLTKHHHSRHLRDEWRLRIAKGEDRRCSTGSENEEIEIQRRFRGFNNRRIKAPNSVTKTFTLPQSIPSSPQTTRKQPSRVTREPKGTDGTKGFHQVRNASS